MFNFGVKIWILGKILIFKTHILPCRTPATYNTGIAKLTNIYSKCYKFSEALLTQFPVPRAVCRDVGSVCERELLFNCYIMRQILPDLVKLFVPFLTLAI